MAESIFTLRFLEVKWKSAWNHESCVCFSYPRYSYGENVDGAFHSRFGLKFREEEEGKKWGEDEKKEITFIRGMEKTGAVRHRSSSTFGSVKSWLYVKSTNPLAVIISD